MRRAISVVAITLVAGVSLVLLPRGHEVDAHTDAGTRTAYQAGILGIVRRDAPRANRLFSGVVYPNRTGPECAAETQALHRTLQRIVRQIELLDPPANIAPLHHQVLINARKSIEVVGEASRDARRETLACGDRMNDRIYGLRSTRRAERAIRAIEAHGYVVFGE